MKTVEEFQQTLHNTAKHTKVRIKLTKVKMFMYLFKLFFNAEVAISCECAIDK